MVYFTKKKYLEYFGVILVFFFKKEADDAVKKDKTTFKSHFAAEPLIIESVPYIRET